MKHKMRRHFSLEDRREEQTTPSPTTKKRKNRLLWEERVREKVREAKIDWTTTLRGRKEKMEVCMFAYLWAGVCVCNICVDSGLLIPLLF